MIYIIMYLNGISVRFFAPAIFCAHLVTVFPAVTAFMGIFEVNNSLLIFSRPVSMFFLWVGATGLLIVFKRIGTFIIGKDFSKAVYLIG
jgi:hypothetical protein